MMKEHLSQTKNNKLVSAFFNSIDSLSKKTEELPDDNSVNECDTERSRLWKTGQILGGITRSGDTPMSVLSV